jgi:hypothetical protein
VAELLAPVDAESLAIDYLNDGGDLAPASGKRPHDWQAGDPWIRVTRIGGVPNDGIGHLDRARLQVEAYDADEPTAFASAGAALTKLRLLPSSGFEFAGAVVTGVDQDLGMTNSPDPETGADRYLFGVVLYVHPVES